MDFWQIIMTPFSWLLKVFCQLTNSYAIALILFTLVVKIILFPLSLKGKKSMIKMNMVSGQLREIQKRCGNDKARYNQEVQKFYSENNVSPMGGCGWSMIPLLILMPLYAIIRRPLKYMMGMTDAATVGVAAELGWAAAQGSQFTVGGYNELTLASMINTGNLAKAAGVAGAAGVFIINFNFLGIDLSRIPQLTFWNSDLWAAGDYWGAIGLVLLPIISAGLSLVSMIVSQKTNQMNKNQPDAAAGTNRTMMLISPLLSLWIGFTLPAGLCIYWIANSLLMMGQEIICGKILKKDYEAAQKEMEEQERKAKEAEKERRRQSAQRKAEAIAAGKGKGKKVQPQSRQKGVDMSASREGMRTYARGRAYDPDRYPITPYHDPDEKYKKKDPDLEPLTEEEKQILAEEGIAIPQETVREEAPLQQETAGQAPEAEGDYEEAYAQDNDEPLHEDDGK